MRGRIGKRGKTWFYVADAPSENGKRKQVWKGGFTTRKAAEDALSKLIADVREGGYVPASKQTVEAYLEEWLAGLPARLRRGTVANYASNVRLHVIPRIGRIPLQRLTAGQLNRLYADLREQGLSQRTVQLIHTILRKALADAVKRRLVPANEADRADRPQVIQRKRMETWSALELRRFLEHVRDDRLYASWLLAATTGMRRGEVLGLRWADVDLEAGNGHGTGRLSVTQALTSVEYKLVFGEPKTKCGHRSIALDAATVAALKEHRRHQLEERLQWGPAYQDNGLVFTREDGSPAHPDRWTDAFERHVKAAGLKTIRVHDVRHTYATLALQAGIPAKVVSERLGHSSIAITIDTYSHVIPEMDESAADRIASLILGKAR